MPAMVEIHQQESQVVQHIDAGQLFGELDAIEQQRPSVDETDIAQMQVAVTAAHLARLPALVEQPAMASQFAVEAALEAIDLRRGKAGRAAIAQNADVGLGHLGHRGARRRGQDGARPSRETRRYGRSAHTSATLTARRPAPNSPADRADRSAASPRRNRAARPRSGSPSARPHRMLPSGPRLIARTSR